MTSTTINSFELFCESRDTRNACESRDDSKDIENCPEFPDAHLSSGLLLVMLLLTIFGLAGGVWVVLIAACVLIVGLSLGIIWKLHFPLQVDSIINLSPSINRSNRWSNAKTHWLKQNDRKIFFDGALDGYYM